MAHKSSKHIVIYDFNAHGHHPFYLEAVAECLLEMGCTVTLCGQINDNTAKHLTATYSSRFGLWQIAPPKSAKGKITRNLWMGRHSWTEAANILSKVTRRMGRKPDLTLFLSFADFNRGFIDRGFVEGVFDYPWGGLMVHLRPPGFVKSYSVPERIANYLQAHHPKLLHPLDVLNAKNCQFFLTLQEDCVSRVAGIVHPPTKVFPDLTQEEFCTNNPLIKEIQAKSAGRKIIVLPGNQNVRKGSRMLLEMAQMARNKPWLFVFAGDENYSRTREGRANLLNQLRQHSTDDNCFVHLEPILDSSIFNGLFAIADVIFAVYNNFPFSSNVLSKAALFRRPILTAHHLMGQRVEKYQIGKTCSFDDKRAALQSIEEILSYAWPEENFASYYQLHSLARTKEILSQLLSVR